MENSLKILLAIIVLHTSILVANAQLFYNNGAAVMISSAATVQVNGSMQNQSGNITVSTGTDANVYITGDLTNNSTITDHGNIHLNGNWINNATFNCSTGEVLLEGANQNLSGTASTTFYDLTLLGTGIKTQTINQTTSGTLSLNDRELATENFTMFVTNTAVNAIQRTSGFVSSLGTGSLSRNTNLTSTYLFPTGSSVGTTRYRPVELTPANTSANTYTVRLANVEAGTESFNRSLKPDEICLLNPNFYHRINRTSGSSAVNMNIYYDETADGTWQGIANWTTAPQWQIAAGSSTSAGTPMNKASVNNWNTFSQTPYILYMENITINLGDDQSICEGNSTTLTVPTGYTYIWSNGANTNSINVTTAGTYSVTVSAESCTDSDTIDVILLPAASVDLGAPSVSACEGENVSLDAGPGYTYFWSNGATSQTLTVTTSGTYIVTVTNSSNCTNSDQVVVTFQDEYNATITSETEFCDNIGTINLTAIDNGGQWTGDGITNASNGTFSPNTAGAGAHQIIYTISGACGDADTTTITVNETPIADLDASDESCLNRNDGKAWVANITNGLAPFSYLWENNSTSDTATSLSPGEWSVIITDVNGCKTSDTIQINGSTEPCYITNIYVPNIFSPNGDGNNDVLYARGSGIDRIVFIVYDRWGEKVFESNSETVGWDGKFKDEDVEEGVYFYYLNAQYLDNTDETLKGNVTVVR